MNLFETLRENNPFAKRPKEVDATAARRALQFMVMSAVSNVYRGEVTDETLEIVNGILNPTQAIEQDSTESVG